MPHIISLLPTAPALPAATPAATASAVAPGAPGTMLTPDLTSPNFLAQFKAALKTIANVVVLPQLAPRPVADPNAGPLMSPVPDDKSEAPGVKSDESVDAIMPELLAQLGFAVVPTVFPMPTPPKLVTTESAPAAPPAGRIAQDPLAALRVGAQLGPVLPQDSAVPVQPQAATVPAAPFGPPRPGAKLAQTLSSAPLAPPQPAADRAAPILSALLDLPRQAQPAVQLEIASIPVPVAHQPVAQLKPSDLPQSPAPAVGAQPSLATAPAVAATAMLQPAPGTQVPPSAPPVANSPTAPQIGFPPPASQNGAQSGGGSSDHDRRPANKTASISAAGTLGPVVPASDVAVAAAAAMATPVNAAPVAVPIGPSQVVSQIASHANLIRLPGNRGLHIQLHPDDLGGVQVTVRYSATGGVELHINAEHAATGALVQAGWTELRDALASHGISADRLMMSVTASPGAGQPDLSGGGNRRSDSDSASGGQGSLNSPDSQSQGQSRQDNTQQRAAPGWRGGLEPISPTDDSSRVAAPTAAPSRIDYRV